MLHQISKQARTKNVLACFCIPGLSAACPLQAKARVFGLRLEGAHMKVAVSACLLGVPCRFDGRSKPSAAVQGFLKRFDCQVVRICPEVMGGLSIPHPPHEQKLVDGSVRVVDARGNDHTDMFLEGSRKACNAACAAGCTHAILKAKSPSCGVGEVYDGSFSDALVPGNGTAAQMMLDAGMRLATEKDIERCMAGGYANSSSSSAEAFFR